MINQPLVQLHPTEMNYFKKCPRKYKEDNSLFDMRNSYHWNLFDAARNSDWDLSPHIDYFLENMTSDAMIKGSITKLQMRRYLETGISNIRKDIAKIKSKYKPYMQLTMFMPYSDRIIVGTPDIYYHKTDEDIYIVMDCKGSMIWLYNTDETWTSMQPPVYCKFVMDRHKVDTVKFAYYVVNKWSWEIKLESRIYTRELCEQMIDECVTAYDYAKNFDEYLPRQSEHCHFCKVIDTCPLRKGKEIIQATDLSYEIF